MKLYKEFFRYVIPSMFAFALSGLYGIVDGFFLGNELGDGALAAINVAYPMTAFLQAIGTGIGMGGAVQYTILKASGKEEEKEKCLGLTLLLLGGAGAVLTPVFLLGNTFFLDLLGAEGELLWLGREYLCWISIGAIFQVLGTGMIPFMRNIGGAIIPMIGMVIGSILNIIFDYVFVWVLPLGMKGAAIASVMGQMGAFAISGFFLWYKKEKICWKKASREQLKKILFVGISPFGLSFAPNVTLILVNLSAINYGGDLAVKAYAPISYIVYTIMMLLQGVSDGCQPLVSMFYGKGQNTEARKVYRLSRNFSLLVGGICFVLLLLEGRRTVGIFGTSEEVTSYVLTILPYFLAGMFFSALSRPVISYYYATEKNKRAYFLIYGESIALFFFLAAIPVFMGILGTWLSVMFSQLFMAVVAQAMVERRRSHFAY